MATEIDLDETRIAVRCRHCRGWLVAPDSVARRAGKKCAACQSAGKQAAATDVPLPLEIPGVGA